MKRVNPFYILLVVVGLLFAITACAYGVMAVKQLHAADFPLPGQAAGASRSEADARFIALLDQYGPKLMVVELAMLGLTTFAAIGTDRFWTGED